MSGGQPGDVITAAKPVSLIEHLRENHKSVDPDYTEVGVVNVSWNLVIF